MGWRASGNDPGYGPAVLGHRDRLTLLNTIDDRAGLVLEFADAHGRLLHRGYILAQSGHKGNGSSCYAIDAGADVHRWRSRRELQLPRQSRPRYQLPLPQSDVDFLVVEPEVASEAEESVRLHRTLRDLRLPADVIVVSRDYAERWREVRGGVVHVALSQGRILAG